MKLDQEIYKADHRVMDVCNQMLTDEQIDLYMSLVEKKFKSRNIKCLNSFYVTSLMKNVGHIDMRHTNSFFKKLINSDGTLPERVVIPVYIPIDHMIGHWVFMCICFETRHFLYIDSKDSRDDIYQGRYAQYFRDATKVMTVIIKIMEESTLSKRWPHIFKAVSPWVLCRTFQLFPQKDAVSCGFYGLMATRICVERSFNELIVYDMKNIGDIKKHIAMELINNEIVDIQGLVRIVTFPGLHSTAKFNKMPNMRARNSIRLSCIINPNQISNKTNPSFRYESDTRARIERLIKHITLMDGDTLKLYIDGVDEDREVLLCTLYQAFEVITESRHYYIDNVEKFIIYIQSDAAMEAFEMTDGIVAMERDYERNEITFEDDLSNNLQMTMLTHDIVACLFHSLVQSCDVDIFAVSESETISMWGSMFEI
jgi:hypothetical protein